MVLQFGYWNLRGLFEPITLVLEYLGTPYETKFYKTREEWFEKDKPNMGPDFDFPNLPWMIDGDLKLWQSSAILKHVGRKGGLFGSDSIQELAKQEAMFDTVHDMRFKFILFCYGKGDLEADKPEYLENLNKVLALFESRLAARKWLTGDNLFIGDFVFWTTLDYLELIEPTILDKYASLARFKKEFSQLEPIAKYLASDKFKKFPITSPFTARWGGQSA